MGDQQKRTLGNYEILEKIGQGGMGAVYRARQISIGRIVALKILPPRLARDENYVARFLREARSAGVCSHPNLILVHDAGEAEGYYYFSMEFVDGDSLGQRLKRDGPLDPDQAVTWMLQIATALREAHRKGIVHRDVKPDNILIGAGGEAKLADLGLAKPMSGEADVTLGGNALGTPLYMSPEQAKGEAVDGRADLYGLGATFWHLLAGEAVFTGPSVAAITIKHVNEAPRNLSQVRPEIDPGLAGIFTRLLEKNPEFRYQDADELLADLRDWRSGAAVADRTVVTGPTRPPGPRSARAQAGPAGGRRWLPWLGAAALMLLLVAAGGGLLMARNGQPDPPPTGGGATEGHDEDPGNGAGEEDDGEIELPPPPDEHGDTRLQELGTALRRLRQRYGDDPTASAEVLRELETLRSRAEGTELVRRIDRFAAQIREDRLADAFRRLKERVDSLLAAHDYDAAMDAATGFAPEPAGGKLADDLRAMQLAIFQKAQAELARRAADITFELAVGDAEAADRALTAFDELRFESGLLKLEQDRQQWEKEYELLRRVRLDELAREWRKRAEDLVGELVAGELDAATTRIDELRRGVTDPTARGWLDDSDAVITALAAHRRAILDAVTAAAEADRAVDFTWQEDGKDKQVTGELAGHREDDDGLVLRVRIRRGGAVALMPVPWDRLPADQRAIFDGDWQAEDAHDRVALAIEALRGGDVAAARKALDAAGDHPLGAVMTEVLSAAP